MKKIVWIIFCLIWAQAGIAQTDPIPTGAYSVLMEDGGFTFALSRNVIYVNNSRFYNQDNIFQTIYSPGNGNYITPGNSDPLNREIVAPDYTERLKVIYNGDLPALYFRNQEQ